jgi:hypothetical protein
MQGNVSGGALCAGFINDCAGKGKGPGAVTPEALLAAARESCLGEMRLQGATCLQAIPTPVEAQGMMREIRCEKAHTANVLTLVVAR